MVETAVAEALGLILAMTDTGLHRSMALSVQVLTLRGNSRGLDGSLASGQDAPPHAAGAVLSTTPLRGS